MSVSIEYRTDRALSADEFAAMAAQRKGQVEEDENTADRNPLTLQRAAEAA